MQSFEDAGIYVLADLGDGIEDIFRTQLPTWTYTVQRRFNKLIDSFQNYNNVLGFVVASEIVTDKNRTAAMPFVKAAVRDVKAYLKMKGYRNIPIGYTGSDDVVVQKVPAYMVCTDIWNTPVIDFYGISLYSWCGDSNLEASGYQRQIQNFRSYPKPVIISEYGCNKPSPRSFTEASAIYGDKAMTDVFSGGIAYQYYNDSYGYGKFLSAFQAIALSL
jgi:endo-1,4-beta-mannosidase